MKRTTVSTTPHPKTTPFKDKSCSSTSMIGATV